MVPQKVLTGSVNCIFEPLAATVLSIDHSALLLQNINYLTWYKFYIYSPYSILYHRFVFQVLTLNLCGANATEKNLVCLLSE